MASESELPQSTIVQPAEKSLDQPEPINGSESSTSIEQAKQRPALNSLKKSDFATSLKEREKNANR